jgi:glycosyltransferase involved in cell wall biosynthesis
VLFTGPLYGQDKLSAYVGADVYVLPSFYETFPLLIEACACGTPVIVTPECGIADLVKNFGCVVERDAGELCTAMCQLLSNEKNRRNLGQKGRQFVARELSWDKIIIRIEEIYRNVTAGT